MAKPSLAIMIGKVKPPSMRGKDEEADYEKEPHDNSEIESAFADLVDALGLKDVDHEKGVEALKNFMELCDYQKTDEEESE